MAAQNPDISNAASTMHSMYQNNYVYDECWQHEEENRIRRSLYIEGKIAGKTEGKIEGKIEGKTEGENLFAALAQKLIADNLIDELTRATLDKAYRQELYKRYNL